MTLQEQFLIQVEYIKDNLDSESEYPFNLDIVKTLDMLSFHKNVTFITWENWAWKSTLIEAIAIGSWLNGEWWSKNIHFSTENTHSELHNHLRIAKWYKQPKDSYFLRAESFYNVASDIDRIAKDDKIILDWYGWKSLHHQSHWESFFSLFTQRFWWEGLYILDEPESALSIQKQLAFLVRLDDLVKENSQFVIVTHSPIILSYPKAKIYEATPEWFIERKYSELEWVNLYKDFLNNPEYMCKKLWIE